MENLQNDNIQEEHRIQYKEAVNPEANQPAPSGLQERMSQSRHKIHHSTPRLGLVITAVVFFVVLGVGAWWYYAQGQVLWMIRQAEWNWGTANLENYQQDTSMDISIRNRSNDPEKVYLSMFGFGGENFNLQVDSQQKNIGLNGESDTDINLKSGDFDIKLDLQTKKIGDKMFLTIDAGNLGDALQAFIPPSFFENLEGQWFEFDIEESYDVSVNQEKLAKINERFNTYLQDLKDAKIFDFEDLGEDTDGYRQIKLLVKQEKIEDFSLLSINYVADTYDILLRDSELSDYAMNFREDALEDFEKTKNEKPEDWQNFKDMFKAISFTVFINSDTYIIHGIAINANNLELKDNSYSTIVNGSLKYFVNEIDYYEIERPSDVRGIEYLGEVLSGSMGSNLYESQSNLEISPYDLGESDMIDTDGDGVMDGLELYFKTDPNNVDTDGDGYTDGEEIDNGYNPTGEGLIDPELIEFLQSERAAAILSSDVEYYLEQMRIASILCHDQGQDLQYSINYVCDGKQAPILGNFICPSSSSIWPDIGYYGFTYTACNSDVENGTFEYGVSNGEVSIICDQESCVTQ